MAKKKKKTGFQSAAGLIRYFDAEEELAPHISPWLVIAMGIGLFIVVDLIKYLYPI